MTDHELLKEVRGLYALGFAIHWLHPKSKRPLESGWTTGPRKSWEELEKSFYPGLNVGVRLGTPSKIGENYLAVVDLDVKSTDPRHRKEAIEEAQKILKGKLCPVVRSGRGNGSRHYYCVTSEPFKTFNAAESSEQVEVFMPSKSPSKKETATLSPEKLKKGIRIANAWEISLYSEGRQVVLPPSIHPDSEKPYVWAKPLVETNQIPLFSFDPPHLSSKTESKSKSKRSPLTSTIGVPLKEDFHFNVSPVELGWLSISDRIRKGIEEGLEVTDRSAFLLPAASALFSAGCSSDEVLTVLTDPESFLGACAYDHAKTKDRRRAAFWVWKYTVKRVMEERDAVSLFKKAAQIEPLKLLSEEEVKVQAQELGEGIYKSEEHGFHKLGPKGGSIPDHTALLEHFLQEYPYKMIVDMKSLYVFNGTHYEDFTPFEVKAFAERNFNPKPIEKTRMEFLHKIMANHIERRNFFISTTEGKINFKNGVLDLMGEGSGLLPHSPDLGFRWVLPYEYDADADCPVFKRWLFDIMLGDKALVRILQEYMGYIVRGGEYRYHKALWLDGAGRNGKSTFIDLLKALIGHSNYSTLSIKALVGDKFASSSLDGKIANFSEETSPQELSDSGPFKNLTSGGDMPVQKKFGDIYTCRNRAKLVMSYNVIPDLKDLSPGMLSRPLIIPFKKEIEEEKQDHDIMKKLLAELSGIFNFALRGWKRLEAQNHFTKSEKSQLALKRIAEESCNVFQWIENYVDFSENKDEFMLTKELFSYYRVHERASVNMVNFCRKLARHPGVKKRLKHTEKGNGYWGVKIR